MRAAPLNATVASPTNTTPVSSDNVNEGAETPLLESVVVAAATPSIPSSVETPHRPAISLCEGRPAEEVTLSHTGNGVAAATPLLESVEVVAATYAETPHRETVSLCEWRPAEEVVPEEPSLDQVEMVEQGHAERSFNFVYSRRSRAQPQAEPQPPSPAANFINNITKPVRLVLPTPKPQRPRKQAATTSQEPRRSRRIAKLPPEIQHHAAKTVCHQLGFSDNRELSDDTMDKYAKFFCNPLSTEHVKALARLLGKNLPMEHQAQETEVLISG